MKKSFKKAGAAVLSMAMLLSMGAMSMPVYAADVVKPATVTVQIAGATTPADDLAYQGEGARDDNNGDGSDKAAKSMPGHNDYTFKYDYLNLDGVTGATVTMYRVAQLTNDKGWDWEDYIKTYTNNGDIPGFTDFASLLKNKDGDPNNVVSGITQDYEFNTKSSDLKQLAAYLERAVEDLKTKASNEATAGSSTTYQNLLKSISTASVTVDSVNIANGVTLPEISAETLDLNGDGVVDASEAALTENVIGYYLIVTETDQSGVLVQPVLISLKNGDNKKVTLKGSTIDINKKMTTITPEVEKSKDLSATFNEPAKSGLVSKNDKVYYEISAQLPKYDVNVNSELIKDFVITDTMSTGLTLPNVVAENVVDPDQFEVFLVDDPENKEDASKRWTLTGSDLKNYGDYQLTRNADGHGFTLTITGYQMRESDTRYNVDGAYTAGTVAPNGDDTVDTVQNLSPTSTSHNFATETLAKATRLNRDANKGNFDKMENAFIYVRFYADVNKEADGTDATPESDMAFNRTFTDYIEVKDIESTDVTAVGENFKDIENQVARAKLFGETLYNKTYSAPDYAVDCFDSEDRAAIIAALTAAGCNGLTASSVSSTEPANELSDYNAANLNADSAEGEFLRILALLAMDKHNITLNGEYNTAKMTYGNRYSTGGGDGEKKTDYSKVYSVDLQLDKFVETVTVAGAPHIDETLDGYVEYAKKIANTPYTYSYTYDNSGATTTKEVTFTLNDLTGADSASDEYKAANAITATVPSFTAPSPSTENWTYWNGLTDQQKKMVADLVAKENTRRDDNLADGNDYDNKFEKNPVVGAIFHLVRKYNDGTENKKLSLGYSMSTTDGSLQKFENVTEPSDTEPTTVPAIAGKTGFIFKDENGKYRIGYLPTSTGADGKTIYSGDNTWRMIEVGDYELTELSVPTGFKKWADPVLFKVSADKESASPKTLAANAFLGSYDATAEISLNSNANESIGIASIADLHNAGTNDATTPTTLHFKFTNNPDGDEAKSGVLSHDLFNQYNDTLPATGGIGTVLFTAGGIAVILMAGALFVVYMKKRNAEEEE